MLAYVAFMDERRSDSPEFVVDQQGGDTRFFRSARQALGIKPFQQPGRKGGGWIWVLPGQAPIH
jgi:hypothetical protein